MFSKFHSNVQQILEFSLSTDLATDTAELGEHEHLFMIPAVQNVGITRDFPAPVALRRLTIAMKSCLFSQKNHWRRTITDVSSAILRTVHVKFVSSSLFAHYSFELKTSFALHPLTATSLDRDLNAEVHNSSYK